MADYALYFYEIVSMVHCTYDIYTYYHTPKYK